ncbi:MAG: glycosyltransferase family 2 protein [Acidobacteria bacterium]|nr:glycosyltransferase family 2 protein [Acidobacteriota bacterium]
MAYISYWFLSPGLFLAILGKLKGQDRTRPTPDFDWRAATVDVAIPARDEENSIALALASLFRQDFPTRKVTVIDDGSSDRTAEVVRRYGQLSGHPVELVAHQEPAGKTPSIRERCQASDADALLILDADTVLTDANYVSRSIEELFKNAGTASVCGEVTPLTRRCRRMLAQADPVVSAVQAEFGLAAEGRPSRLQALLEYFTVIYRSTLYVYLQRFVYDGQMKLFGSRLSPIGCAVAYRNNRLRECFDFAGPRMGDNLSNSEDIFIGHFFAWKGYRNVQVMGVRCASIEPPVGRLPAQLYLWSSSFLQATHYFRDLPLSPFKKLWNRARGLLGARQKRPPSKDDRRRIQEQYRAPWGETYTKRFGRHIGLLDLASMIEKITYPLILFFLMIFNPKLALFTRPTRERGGDPRA